MTMQRISHYDSRPPVASKVQSSGVLSSWKEIANFFGKGVRTVQRWEHSLGLPVSRPTGAEQNIVFARTDELQMWLDGKRKRPTAQEPVTRHQEESQRMRLLVATLSINASRLQQNLALAAEQCGQVVETQRKARELRAQSALRRAELDGQNHRDLEQISRTQETGDAAAPEPGPTRGAERWGALAS